MTPLLHPSLAATDLTFAWGRRVVLDAVSLAVPRGQHLALLGPNGSGKSTLLRLAAGLLTPGSGAVSRAAAGLGVVFQHPALDSALTAFENLVLAGRLHGLASAASRSRATDLLSLVGLADRARDKVKNLSGGMRRRLDLARALVPEPELLLLDEPTAGLDLHHFEGFWSHLGALRKTRNLTIVTATHRPDEAILADRLVMMAGGKIVHDDTPEATLRALGSDLVLVTAAAPDAVAQTLRDDLGMSVRLDGATLVCEVPADETGARMLVRIVERFPPGRLDSIVLRRASLADVFVKLTGQSLASPLAEAA